LALSVAEKALASRQLAELQRVAQERLGLTTAATVYAAWSGVAATAPDPATWYEVIESVAAGLRKVSSRLAARFYTLSRAIGTGYGLPDPAGERAGPTVSLAVLVDEFRDSLEEVIAASDATEAEVAEDYPDAPEFPQTEDDVSPVEPEPDVTLDERLDEIDDILIDMLDQIFNPLVDDESWEEALPVDTEWRWEDFEETEQDLSDAMEDLYSDLDDRVIADLDEKVDRELSSDRTMQESLTRIDDASRNAGALGAAYAEQTVLQPGRRLARKAGDSDRRRFGWMRCTGPKPCAFCAMLASRGAVYDTYASGKFTTNEKGFKDTYHPNCHCYVVAVWMDEPYYSPRDQYFISKWEDEIRNKYFGKEALREWRRRLTLAYREEKVPDAGMFGERYLTKSGATRAAS
jgi:hypothetical protein